MKLSRARLLLNAAATRDARVRAERIVDLRMALAGNPKDVQALVKKLEDF